MLLLSLFSFYVPSLLRSSLYHFIISCKPGELSRALRVVRIYTYTERKGSDTPSAVSRSPPFTRCRARVQVDYVQLHARELVPFCAWRASGWLRV